MVPKLGVPGRPAGGIDCLAQIGGYATAFDAEQLRGVLTRAGYAHFLADGRFAPLDARVFKLRQQHGSQEVPTLVAASLLSKKLAVGVQRAGLDVRVSPYGNFGSSWNEARTNARLFIRAAAQHSVQAYPVLTDGRQPYQPCIGRSEALLALASVFDGSASGWLAEHVEQCRALALAVAPEDGRAAADRKSVV